MKHDEGGDHAGHAHGKAQAGLTLERAYDPEPLQSTRDKERPRVIPVHPELAKALGWWKREGWAAFYGRPPRPEDPIIPNFFKKGHHTVKSVYHRSRDAFTEAKLGCKAHHACRHAFMTTARRRGAIELYIERITTTRAAACSTTTRTRSGIRCATSCSGCPGNDFQRQFRLFARAPTANYQKRPENGALAT